MAINTDLLVAAPMLQDYLVDKSSGMPLTNGIITLYQDTQRTVLKNWYYQTGVPGAYTWIPLDNPLHLSTAGTIQDPNGNDVIPFYYPFDETNENIPQAYYITVYNVDLNGNPAVLQFTRENFPFQPTNASPQVTVPTLRNYIVNNNYWRNIGSLDCKSVTNQIIAPSQHDGFTNGDIRFVKDVTGATETLSFITMASVPAVLQNDITPEYCINMTCTAPQAGEGVKCVQYPVSLHINTLDNVQASVVIHAANVMGNPNGYLDLYIYEYLGSGALSQPNPILIQRIILNNSFQKFVIPFTFPNAAGLSLGAGDDAFFLRVQYPLSVVFNINHTKPQIYLSDDVPDNNFDTYDESAAIMNSPRTQDFRISLNSFQPGWVLCNDGVISNSGTFTLPTNVPSARANIDTWPLYSNLWALNPIVTPIYDNAGVLSTRGVDAITDWKANKQLQLTLVLGRSLIGLPPAVNVTYDRTVTPSWGSVAGTFTVSAGLTTLFYVGAPIYLTGTMPAGGNFTANTIYYAIPSIDGSSSTQFQLASSYANALAGTAIAAGAASNNGSNLVVNFALGGSLGEARHVQLVRELAAHNHSGSTYAPYIHDQTAGAGGAVGVPSDSGTGSLTLTIATNGSSDPFNIVQPSIYGNIFLKL